MKSILLALCLTGAFVIPTVRAQDVTSADLNKAVAYLEKTRAGVVAATAGLSEAQWNFKQATNRWSIAEVTEHIAAAEDLLMNLIRGSVMNAPARTETEDVTALDELVLQRLTDRTHKAQAPEPLIPTKRFGSPEESLKHFQASRAKTDQFLKSTKDLRQHAYNLPAITWLNGKKLDAYQWVLYIAAHSERHTKQILEVKEAPAFPKS
jgi:hypothetical protein